MSSGNRSAVRERNTASWPVLVALACVLLAAGASIWAVRADNARESAERELADIRASASASVYPLEPTGSAPGNTQGQVFINLSGSGAIIVSNLPPAGDNEEFMIWYLAEDDSATAGGKLSVDEHGQGFALVPGDSDGYSRIAISLEPADSTEPGGTFLLIAQVQAGRG